MFSNSQIKWFSKEEVKEPTKDWIFLYHPGRDQYAYGYFDENGLAHFVTPSEAPEHLTDLVVTNEKKVAAGVAAPTALAQVVKNVPQAPKSTTVVHKQKSPPRVQPEWKTVGPKTKSPNTGSPVGKKVTPKVQPPQGPKKEDPLNVPLNAAPLPPKKKSPAKPVSVKSVKVPNVAPTPHQRQGKLKVDFPTQFFDFASKSLKPNNPMRVTKYKVRLMEGKGRVHSGHLIVPSWDELAKTPLPPISWEVLAEDLSAKRLTLLKQCYTHHEEKGKFEFDDFVFESSQSRIKHPNVEAYSHIFHQIATWPIERCEGLRELIVDQFSKDFFDSVRTVHFANFLAAAQVCLVLSDVALIANPRVLSSETFRALLKKTFEVCIRNRDRVVASWKSAVEHMKRVLSHTHDGSRWIPAPDLGLDFGEFLHSLPSSTRHERELLFGCLTARSMPKPTANVVPDKLEDFKKVVTRENPCSGDLLEAARAAAVFLGKEVEGKWKNSTFNLDVSRSATYDFTRKFGGRFGEFHQIFIPFLKSPVGVERTVDLPHGRHVIPADVAPWRVFAGPGECFGALNEGEFDDPRDADNVIAQFYDILGMKGLTQGLNKDLGWQLLVWALLDSVSTTERKVRLSPVFECGGKVRWITISKLSTAVLHDYTQNRLQPLFLAHPAIRPIFTKPLLAWEFLKQPRPSAPASRVLYVSDYSSATDAIDHRLAKVLLEGFCEGAGYQLTGLEKVAIQDLTSPKTIYPQKGSSFVTSSGVFMGEGLTKATLTILMYALDILALWAGEDNVIDSEREFELPRGFGPLVPRSRPVWHAFFAPGDDHVATGTDWYLRNLASLSPALGMLLNEDKTYSSDVAIPLCEQWISVPEYFSNSPSQISKADFDSVAKTPWFDIFKLKMMSPATLDDSSFHPTEYLTARSSSIMGLLRNLGDTWTLEEKNRLLWWFLRRSGFLNTQEDHVIHTLSFMPTWAGGLGLALNKEQLQNAFENMPVRWTRLLSLAALKPLSSEAFSLRNLSHTASLTSVEADECSEAAMLAFNSLREMGMITLCDADRVGKLGAKIWDPIIRRSNRIFTESEITNLFKSTVSFQSPEFVARSHRPLPYSQRVYNLTQKISKDLLDGATFAEECPTKVLTDQNFDKVLASLESLDATVESVPPMSLEMFLSRSGKPEAEFFEVDELLNEALSAFCELRI